MSLYLFLWMGCALSYVASSTSEPSEEQCDPDLSVEIKLYREYPNGSLWDVQGDSMYENGTYWKEERGLETIVRGCSCLLDRPCLRKCCPMGQVANSEGHCVDDQRGNIFSPEVTDDDGTNPRTVEGKEHFGLLFGVVRECERKFIPDPEVEPKDGYFIRASDGKIVMHERNLTYGPYNFCVEYVSEKDGYRPFICEPPAKIHRFAMMMYPFTFLVSAVFLFLAFLVYALIPELRNLHGRILMCHMFSFFLAFLFCSLTGFLRRGLSYGMCIAVAFIIEFSFLASFFWLNVMCFDICITFRGLRPTNNSSSKKGGRKFFLYSLYAWGSPTLVLIVTVVMQFTPGLPDDVIKPEFGKIKCYFHSNESLAAYLYAPISTLLISNVIMFIITSISIYKLHKETTVLNSGDSRRHTSAFVDYNKQRFVLYAKLFLVMGITWMMDFVAWMIEAPEYFYLTETWNSLQGLFIFIIFVWKKSIRNMLQQKLCPKMPQHVENLSNCCRWTMPCYNGRVAPRDENFTSERNTTATSLSSPKPNDETAKKNGLPGEPESASFSVS